MPDDEVTFERERLEMVEEQLLARGVTDARVLRAFRAVPRHRFVPAAFIADAYADRPIPIEAGQTISQPYIVALMMAACHFQGHERVLEIGTGSGYQTALLSHTAHEVYSIERIPQLLEAARIRLRELGCHNVQLLTGNGSLGWPERAPYDAILVTAAVPDVPRPLMDQLKEGGRLTLPIGTGTSQELVWVRKRRAALERRVLTGCVFVPLIGQHGWPDRGQLEA